MFCLGEACVVHRVVNFPQRLVALVALVTSRCLTEGEEELVAGKLKLVISDIVCLNYDNKVKLKIFTYNFYSDGLMYKLCFTSRYMFWVVHAFCSCLFYSLKVS